MASKLSAFDSPEKRWRLECQEQGYLRIADTTSKHFLDPDKRHTNIWFNITEALRNTELRKPVIKAAKVFLRGKGKFDYIATEPQNDQLATWLAEEIGIKLYFISRNPRKSDSYTQLIHGQGLLVVDGIVSVAQVNRLFTELDRNYRTTKDNVVVLVDYLGIKNIENKNIWSFLNLLEKRSFLPVNCPWCPKGSKVVP